VAVLLLVLVGTATVHFEPASDVRPHHSRLEISRKGKHWSPHLIRPVFRRQVVLVPGTVRRAGFLVRNRSGDPARLRVTVDVQDPDGWLGDDLLRMKVRTGRGHWVRTRGPGAQRPGTVLVRPHRVVPIKVRVRLKRGAGTTTEDRHLSFSLHLRLTQRTKARHR
jgi:hypothetical protein